MTVREDALAKMLVEMEKKHSPQEDLVHNWLCDQDDDLLFAGILHPEKSIAGAMKECQEKAKKQASNGVAMIQDAAVWGWVYRYFTGQKWKAEDKVTTSTPKPRKKKPVEPEGVEQIDLFDLP